ncbi:MAG: 4Fe-4S dicluster domain-containing protein [Deltaproteobacteria bacterium]|nr:4Fe-4S dicluster domain-containing protein [Deltaproteobacteria bacterium]
MSFSRRGFIKGIAAGTLAAGSAKAAGGYHEFAGYPDGYGLLHDTTLCVGCRSCEVACKQVNDLPPPEVPLHDKSIFENKRRPTKDDYTVVNRYKPATEDQPAVFRKLQCMHCQEPACATVCFVNAFTKTPEGPVLYDPSVCVGCRYCVMACPYYALSYEYDKPFEPRVVRCTMCYPRIKKGLKPGCAAACPMGAIKYGKRKDLIKLARERIRKQPQRYINHVYGEHEFGGTSWLVIGGTSFKELGLFEGVTSKSMPEMGSGFLSVVPLVVTIYPGLLAGFYAFSKRKEKLAKNEKESAVNDALTKADEETKKKLSEAAGKAKKDKEKAIAQAVKKALDEAQQAGKEETK